MPPSLLRGGTREANKPRLHPPRSTDHAELYQGKGSAEEKKYIYIYSVMGSGAGRDVLEREYGELEAD